MQSNDNLPDSSKFSIPKKLVLIFLRQFFKLLYHQFAWSYDLVAWIVSLGSWQKWVLSVIPYIQGPRVLEIGFGPGHLQLAMAEHGLRSFGVDESPQMSRMAHRRLRRRAIHPRVLRGDAEKLPFSSGSFNQVVMTFPSEYVLKPATIAEIRRVLVEKGTVLVVALAWITGRKPWERMVSWVNRITGQAPEWNPKALDPLKEIGFMVSWEEIEFPNSKTIVIRLVKI